MFTNYVRTGTIGFLAVLTFAPVSDAITTSRAAHPPSSVGADTQTRTVHVSHRHERVRRCATLRFGEHFHCAPVLVDADTAATVTFQLVVTPSTVRKAQSVLLTLPSLAGPQESSIELSLGEWLVDWQAYGIVRSLQIGPESAPLISLRTRSGRCELSGNRCRLDADTVSRKMTIVDEHP